MAGTSTGQPVLAGDASPWLRVGGAAGQAQVPPLLGPCLEAEVGNEHNGLAAVSTGSAALALLAAKGTRRGQNFETAL